MLDSIESIPKLFKSKCRWNPKSNQMFQIELFDSILYNYSSLFLSIIILTLMCFLTFFFFFFYFYFKAVDKIIMKISVLFIGKVND